MKYFDSTYLSVHEFVHQDRIETIVDVEESDVSIAYVQQMLNCEVQ